jgi:hypothetical protein
MKRAARLAWVVKCFSGSNSRSVLIGNAPSPRLQGPLCTKWNLSPGPKSRRISPGAPKNFRQRIAAGACGTSLVVPPRLHRKMRKGGVTTALPQSCAPKLSLRR